MIKISENSLLDLLNSSLKADGISRVVAGGLIKNNVGDVLILRRSANDFMGGLDELPSGKVDFEDATLIEALKREIVEETGLTVCSIDSYLGHFDYASRSGTATRQFNFKVGVIDPDKVCISEEHQSFKWYSLLNVHESNMTRVIRDCVVRELENDLLEIAKKENVSVIKITGLILDQEDKVLILRKLNFEHALPSVIVESGETLSQALLRILKEHAYSIPVELIWQYIGFLDFVAEKTGDLTRQFHFRASLSKLGENFDENFFWHSRRSTLLLNEQTNRVVEHFIR